MHATSIQDMTMLCSGLRTTPFRRSPRILGSYLRGFILYLCGFSSFSTAVLYSLSGNALTQQELFISPPTFKILIMKGAKPTIKKQSRTSGEEKAFSMHLEETSPLGVKQLASNKPKRTGVSKQRQIDFSQIDLKAIADSCQPTISTIGQFINYAREVLSAKNNGSVEVAFQVSPIRMPEDWDHFKFFSVADYTGCLSLGAKVSTF